MLQYRATSMSVILTAIVSALAKLAEPAVKDAYDEFKSVLRRKASAHEARIAEKVKEVEDKPQAEGRKAVLQEALKDAGLDRDAEVLELAKKILALAGSGEDGVSVTQTITGNENVFSATGDVFHGTGPVRVRKS